MASRRAQGTRSRLAHLWQLPLLVLALGLFGVAAYLFIDPKPGPTLDQRLERAEALLRRDRPEAARDAFRELEREPKLPPETKARVQLLHGEAVERLQQLTKTDLPVLHAEIIEQTKAALAGGIKPDAAVHRRLAASYEAVGRGDDALTHYRKAIELDPDRALPLRRKVIELYLARLEAAKNEKGEKPDAAAAEAALREYLKQEGLSGGEELWATGELSRLLVDRLDYTGALAVLADLESFADQQPVARGELNYRRGYCEWRLGNAAEAERLLRAARDLLRNQHPLDADAAYLLGQLVEAKPGGDPREALAFYQAVIVQHPGSAKAPPARLRRGVCRIKVGEAEEQAGLNDLDEVARTVVGKPSWARYRPDALAALQEAGRALAARGKHKEVQDLLLTESALDASPSADFFARLTTTLERRAEQTDREAAAATTEPERLARAAAARKFRGWAGDASLAHADKLTISDDKGAAAALLRAVDLFDAAGDLPKTIFALKKFVDERPTDGQTPDALLRLGRSYQAAGQFDKAIAAYQENQFKHAKTIAASKSGVPLAQAYVAKGPAFYGKAEAALVATLENPLLTPDAEDFKDALFDLGQLYYRTGRFEDAVTRFSEMAERYPAERRTGQLLFLMADSYRKSAALLKQGTGVAAGVPPAGAAAAPAPSQATDSAALAAQLAARAEAATARRDRLTRARALFDRSIEQFRVAPPARDVDKLHLRLAHFYRADCLYDLGEYEEAIRLYDAAAMRYQDDPSALAAYVQIVNAYCALGRTEEARAANERAKWLLRRIPPEAFKDDAFAMPKEYWDNWLKWSGEAGMW